MNKFIFGSSASFGIFLALLASHSTADDLVTAVEKVKASLDVHLYRYTGSGDEGGRLGRARIDVWFDPAEFLDQSRDRILNDWLLDLKVGDHTLYANKIDLIPATGKPENLEIPESHVHYQAIVEVTVSSRHFGENQVFSGNLFWAGYARASDKDIFSLPRIPDGVARIQRSGKFKTLVWLKDRAECEKKGFELAQEVAKGACFYTIYNPMSIRCSYLVPERQGLFKAEFEPMSRPECNAVGIRRDASQILFEFEIPVTCRGHLYCTKRGTSVLERKLEICRDQRSECREDCWKKFPKDARDCEDDCDRAERACFTRVFEGP